MDFFSIVVFLLLVTVALGIAWLAGYRSRFRKIPGLKRSPDQDYFIGLNYLLNDEPDDAIDIFTAGLELNGETLDTHLALCTLLRRRGKVDRAIAHNQQLLDSELFNTREISEIKINLVRCYVAAGLLDRAERLLDELKSAPPAIREAALGLSITLYQMEKDWPQALAAANDLLKICAAARRPELQLQTSHFYCELAEAALSQHNLAAAREELKKAISTSRSNVRIYFLLGSIEAQMGNYREAVKALQKVQQYDRHFAGEACPPLLEYLQKAGMDRQLDSLLEEARVGDPGSRELLALIAVMKEKKGNQLALEVLQQQLKKNPTLGVLAQTLSVAATREAGQEDVLELGASILEQYLHNCAQYRCDNCGFELRNLHWCCPGCSRWGQVRPLEGKLPLL